MQQDKEALQQGQYRNAVTRADNAHMQRNAQCGKTHHRTETPAPHTVAADQGVYWTMDLLQNNYPRPGSSLSFSGDNTI